MEKVKVLLFVDRMRTGGIQILLVNLLKVFDKKKYSFDVGRWNRLPYGERYY